MRSRITLLTLLLLVGLFALPHLAHAAIPFFGPIVPEPLNRCAAGWGGVMVVINNIIQFLITIAVVFVAPIMIAYSGFLLVVNQGDSGNLTKAKGILTNTIAGIVIALSAWMIVDALMAVLYKPAGGQASSWGTWSSLIGSGSQDFCLIQEASLTKLNQVDITGSTAQGGLTTTAVPGQLLRGFALGCTDSNDQNAQELVNRGVEGHSTANCCAKDQSTCTSLDGMLPSTIQQIENLQIACGGLIVTGGTEVGHASEGGAGSHSSGSKVDIGQDLTSCIQKTSGSSVVSPPSFGSAQVKDKCGNIYTWEGSHTDIYVNSACALNG